MLNILSFVDYYSSLILQLKLVLKLLITYLKFCKMLHWSNHIFEIIIRKIIIFNYFLENLLNMHTKNLRTTKYTIVSKMNKIC